MVFTKMVGWAAVVVVWVIYAIKQALIRDFFGTIIAFFILGLGVVCFRGNHKKWKAMRAEKKAAKANAQTGGDNITPFPGTEVAADEEETSAEEETADEEEEPAAPVETEEVPAAEAEEPETVEPEEEKTEQTVE